MCFQIDPQQPATRQLSADITTKPLKQWDIPKRPITSDATGSSWCFMLFNKIAQVLSPLNSLNQVTVFEFHVRKQ